MSGVSLLLTAQDGAPSLSFNQPIISNFRNNHVRWAAWGRERNLLCGQGLLSARSFKQIEVRRPSRTTAPGKAARGLLGVIKPAKGFQAKQSPFRRGKSSQVLAPHLQDYPRRTNISSGFKLHPLWQSIYSKCCSTPLSSSSSPTLLILRSRLPPLPHQPWAAASTSAKHRAGLAASQ